MLTSGGRVTKRAECEGEARAVLTYSSLLIQYVKARAPM